MNSKFHWIVNNTSEEEIRCVGLNMLEMMEDSVFIKMGESKNNFNDVEILHIPNHKIIFILKRIDGSGLILFDYYYYELNGKAIYNTTYANSNSKNLHLEYIYQIYLQKTRAKKINSIK